MHGATTFNVIESNKLSRPKAGLLTEDLRFTISSRCIIYIEDMKFHLFTLEKHPLSPTPTTKRGYSQLLMNTFHRKKKIKPSDIDGGWVISDLQICEINDIGDIRILRYGVDDHLEHVFRASKSVWNPVPTSMSAVCSHYNHKLDFRLQVLKRLITDNLFVSIHNNRNFNRSIRLVAINFDFSIIFSIISQHNIISIHRTTCD